jgi:ribosomal protein S19
MNLDGSCFFFCLFVQQSAIFETIAPDSTSKKKQKQKQEKQKQEKQKQEKQRKTSKQKKVITPILIAILIVVIKIYNGEVRALPG